MTKFNLKFLIFTVFPLIIACASTPNKMEETVPLGSISPEKYLQWEAKALIKNTKTGEANILTLDIVGRKPYPVRTEVTTSLGIHLASILIQEKDIQFLLPKSKKYYSGEISPKSLKPILNVGLDPRLIIAALFDESFPDWKCEAQEGKTINCETPTSDKIEWFYKKDEPGKRVEIKGENYESQFQFKSQKEASSIKENTFVLKIPEDYKTYQLKN
jgi:hypothetical protein